MYVPSFDHVISFRRIICLAENSLLNIKETFRRDRVWFAEKDSSQATVLYSPADFNARKDTMIESGYLTGRYGAIPFVSEFTISRNEDDDGA